MASRVVNQGLHLLLEAAFGIGSPAPVDAMGVSDFGTLAAGTTSIAAATNKSVKALDSAPSRNGNVVTCVGLWGTGEANFTITDVTLHNGGAGVYTGLVGGVDALSIVKTSGFSLRSTVTLTLAPA